jgi:hypothetical protein
LQNHKLALLPLKIRCNLIFTKNFPPHITDFAARHDRQGLVGAYCHPHNRVVFIEDEQNKRFKVVFDALAQHTEQLNRIEEKLSIHDDFIFKRIK